LCDNTHTITGSLKQPAEQSGSKRRVIDVCIGTDEEDIDVVPAQPIEVCS